MTRPSSYLDASGRVDPAKVAAAVEAEISTNWPHMLAEWQAARRRTSASVHGEMARMEAERFGLGPAELRLLDISYRERDLEYETHRTREDRRRERAALAEEEARIRANLRSRTWQTPIGEMLAARLNVEAA